MEDINRKCVVYIRLREVLIGIVFFLTFATEISVEYSSSNKKSKRRGVYSTLYKQILLFKRTNGTDEKNARIDLFSWSCFAFIM